MINNEIAVVIPAYNEEKALPEVIERLDKYFSRDQVFLANDGSTDDTALIAEQLGIKIISGSVNKGKSTLSIRFEVAINTFLWNKVQSIL